MAEENRFESRMIRRSGRVIDVEGSISQGPAISAQDGQDTPYTPVNPLPSGEDTTPSMPIEPISLGKPPLPGRYESWPPTMISLAEGARVDNIVGRPIHEFTGFQTVGFGDRSSETSLPFAIGIENSLRHAVVASSEDRLMEGKRGEISEVVLSAQNEESYSYIGEAAKSALEHPALKTDLPIPEFIDAAEEFVPFCHCTRFYVGSDADGDLPDDLGDFEPKAGPIEVEVDASKPKNDPPPFIWAVLTTEGNLPWGYPWEIKVLKVKVNSDDPDEPSDLLQVIPDAESAKGKNWHTIIPSWGYRRQLPSSSADGHAQCGSAVTAQLVCSRNSKQDEVQSGGKKREGDIKEGSCRVVGIYRGQVCGEAFVRVRKGCLLSVLRKTAATMNKAPQFVPPSKTTVKEIAKSASPDDLDKKWREHNAKPGKSTSGLDEENVNPKHTGIVLVSMSFTAKVGHEFAEPDCCCIYLAEATVTLSIEVHISTTVKQQDRDTLIGRLQAVVDNLVSAFTSANFKRAITRFIDLPKCAKRDKTACSAWAKEVESVLNGDLTLQELATLLKSVEIDQKWGLGQYLASVASGRVSTQTGAHRLFYLDPAFAFEKPLQSSGGHVTDAMSNVETTHRWCLRTNEEVRKYESQNRLRAPFTKQRLLYGEPVVVSFEYYEPEVVAALSRLNDELTHLAHQIIEWLVARGYPRPGPAGPGQPVEPPFKDGVITFATQNNWSEADIEVIEAKYTEYDFYLDSHEVSLKDWTRRSLKTYVNVLQYILAAATPENSATIEGHGIYIPTGYGDRDHEGEITRSFFFLMGIAISYLQLIKTSKSNGGLKSQAFAIRLSACKSAQDKEFVKELFTLINSESKDNPLFFSSYTWFQKPYQYDSRSDTLRFPGLLAYWPPNEDINITAGYKQYLPK